MKWGAKLNKYEFKRMHLEIIKLITILIIEALPSHIALNSSDYFFNPHGDGSFCRPLVVLLSRHLHEIST